jgi:hypothetical protein
VELPAAPHPTRQSIVTDDELHSDSVNTEPNLIQPRHLRVLEAHGSFLYRIKPPSIDSKSIRGCGRVDLPHAMPETVLAWGVPANDRYRDIALDIDWRTGLIRRHVDAPYLRS